MKKILCDEYVSYDDVMMQQEIFCLASGSTGTFFLCFDYYAPIEAKLWYKFSVVPFDIDFLKFRRVGYSIFSKGSFANKGLSIMLRYLHTCKAENALKNTNLLNEVFFRGGKPSVTIRKLSNSKTKNKEEKYGKLDLNRLYRIKGKLTSTVKLWLQRLYREYNFMDNSIEYIQKYYNNWVILVNTIQEQKEAVINPIWNFIKSRRIHSLRDFYDYWDLVATGDIKVRYVTREDAVYLFNIIQDIISNQQKKDE